MQRPKKNSYKESDNEKKFLRLENSPPPPPPHNFLMVRPLHAGVRRISYIAIESTSMLKKRPSYKVGGLPVLSLFY